MKPPTDRELLKKMQKRLQATPPADLNLTHDHFDAFHRLLCRFPYEPGEMILVGPVEIKARFLCTDPSDTNYVWASRGKGAKLYRYHKPLPKTYRVTVPEEVIDKARQITASRIDDVVAANEVCACIANPDNWEAGDES